MESRSCDGLVHVRRREETVEVTDSCLKISDTKITVSGYIWPHPGLRPNKMSVQKMIEILRNHTSANVPGWIKEIPDYLKTQRICDKAVQMDLHFLTFFPGRLKTEGTCNEAVPRKPVAFFLIPDRFKTKEMCINAFEVDLWQLEYVSDYFKTQEICNKAVGMAPWLLKYVADWFVTQQQIKSWHDDDYYCDDHEIIRWYEGNQKRMAQKAKIKAKLAPIAWHPSRYWDFCVPEDEKKETEKLLG